MSQTIDPALPSENACACASSRLIEAPASRVFEAIQDFERLARWWGPTGFRTTSERFEFRPGGSWIHTMHGPDGTDYANESRFLEIVPNERVVIEHLKTVHHFILSITLTEQDGRTRVDWRQVFDSAEERERVAEWVVPANEQNLDRLEAELNNPEFHPVVAREDWLEARRELLKAEKELSRLNDQLAARRRALPWVKVEKEYHFDTPSGPRSLAELFDGRSQLVVYHFMFGPGWKEGCDGCSFLSDHFDGANLHLAHHDVTLMAVSRAPLAEFLPFKQRMGWRFPWVSSHQSDFNHDFHASTAPDRNTVLYNFEEEPSEPGEEHHGISVFYRNKRGEIFHTYSCYARGVDILCGTHNFLDLTPKGRNEHGTMDWVRLHDRYEDAENSDRCCGNDRSGAG